MILPKVEVKKILYATDLSESARYAFAYAASLANLYCATITILHVISELPSLESAMLGYVGKEKWDEIRRRNAEDAKEILIAKKRDNVAIREVLDTFCENAKANCEDKSFATDEILIQRGNPVEEILKQADKRNCDLIVMGTHGHGTFAGAMLGSTARRVVKGSKKPVLVVRLPKED